MDTKKLRQKILDLAIRGKLVPQDPNDEPASVLLERIRAEKEQLIKDGKIKRSKKSAATDKSHYENVPFEIPESWCWTTLGELFDIVSSKRVLQSDWQRTGIPFYRAREIVRLSYEGYVDNDLFITEEHYNNLKKSYGVPEPSDIMLSAVGTIGRAYVVRNNDVFYYKETSSQVDFVIAKDGNVQELIQVSYDISIEKTRNREIRGLKNAAKKLKCNILTLVTFEEHETIEEDGYIINVVPATRWLLDK